MIFSRVFGNAGRTRIGLSLVVFSESPDLSKGVTFGIFKLLGKVRC